MASLTAMSSSSSSSSSGWFDSARLGEWNPLSALLDSKAIELDAKDADGRTALMLAAEGGHEECVEQLCARGATIDATDESGCTALMYASESGSVSCIRALLTAAQSSDARADLNINAQDSLGETALLKACRAGESEVARTLLEYEEQRCDVELPSESGETPLLAAVSSANEEDLECLKLLLSHPTNAAKVNRPNRLTGESALLASISKDDWTVFQLLLQAPGIELDNTTIDRDGHRHGPPLLFAIEEEAAIKVIQELLNQGAKVDASRNERGYTPLHLAVRDENVELVELLVKHVRTKQNPPQPSNSGSVVNLKDRTSESLLACDTEFGWTPLQHAAAQNSKDIIRIMGEAGVDPNIQDKRGCTALLLAARSSHLPCLKYLIKFGGDALLADSAGRTPFGEAAAAGHVEVVKFMLDKGFKPSENVVDARGNTVVHLICDRTPLPSHALTIIKMLMECSSPCGTFLHAQNKDGETCWTLARKHGHADLMAYFTQIASNIPPAPATITAVNGGEGCITLSFKQPPNDLLTPSEMKYTITATPVTMLDDDANADETTGQQEQDQIDSSKASARHSDNSSSVKKSSSTKKASSSSKQQKKETTSSTSPSKSSNQSIAVSQSVTGPSSPLRLSSLSNGVRYKITLVSTNGAGQTPATCPAELSDHESILVGTPAAPIITHVESGENWASVSFMPAGGSGASAAEAASVKGAASNNGNDDKDDMDKGAVIEFILTASIVGSAGPRTGHASSSRAHAPVFRSVRSVTSPIVLTGLTPASQYDVSIRSRNAYGEGTPSQSRIINTKNAADARADTSKPGHDDSMHAPTQESKHVQWLNTALDSSEIAECQAIVSSALSAELASLVKIHHPAPTRPASAAAGVGVGVGRRPLSALSGGSVSGSTPSGSLGLQLHRIGKIENVTLRRTFESAPLFLSAMGCPRAVAAREGWAFLPLPSSSTARANIELAAYASHGVLPYTHPLSPFYSAHAPSSTHSTDSSPSYNHNSFPVGSPFHGCYLYTNITKKMLIMAAAAAAADGRRHETTDPDGDTLPPPADMHRVLICKVRPGRTRSTDAPPSSSSSSQPASASASASSSSILSTRFDSHHSPLSHQLFLHSPSQILPAFYVEFILPLQQSLRNQPVEMSEEEVLEWAEAVRQVEGLGTSAGDATGGMGDDVGEDPVALAHAQRAFAVRRWMGSAPASAINPPGDVVQSSDGSGIGIGTSIGIVSPPSHSSSQLQSRSSSRGLPPADGDDLAESESADARLDITKAQSALLGPAHQPIPRRLNVQQTNASTSTSAHSKPAK